MPGSAAKSPRACNVCRAPASNLCSRCGIRIYCSPACQRGDWNEHRHYCRRQPSNDELMATLKREVESHGLKFGDIVRQADDPKNAKSVEKYLFQKYGSAATGNTPSPWEDRSWPPHPKSWSLNKRINWAELKKLPIKSNCCFLFSFTTAGYMDEITGDLLFVLHGLESDTGKVRVMGCCLGKPTRFDLDNAIYEAMVRPKSDNGGSMIPERPSHMLFAHRWGKDITSDLIELLKKKLGIEAMLETEEASLVSARTNGTDPEGYNWNVGEFVNTPLIAEY